MSDHKLSEKQRLQLSEMAEAGRPLMLSADGTVFFYDGRFSIRKNASTFNSLVMRGYIEKTDVRILDGVGIYTITDLGRSALSSGESA